MKKIEMKFYTDSCCCDHTKLYGNFWRGREDRYANQFIIHFEVDVNEFGDIHFLFIAERAINGKSTGECLFTHSFAPLWIGKYAFMSEAIMGMKIYANLKEFLYSFMKRVVFPSPLHETYEADYSEIDYCLKSDYMLRFCENAVNVAKRKLAPAKKKYLAEEKKAVAKAEDE